ncbi:MAG: hypothetical protein ACRCY3_05805 [Sphingorhabdus sp.]
MSAATHIALAAVASQPYDFVTSAMVGSIVPDAEKSQLSPLLLPQEKAILATAGELGCALFTSHRLLVGEQTGIMTKRLAVKVLRRDTIMAYTIDPHDLVTMELIGGFGHATLNFDKDFNPMALSEWLGETLIGSAQE